MLANVATAVAVVVDEVKPVGILVDQARLWKRHLRVAVGWAGVQFVVCDLPMHTLGTGTASYTRLGDTRTGFPRLRPRKDWMEDWEIVAGDI
jgi:hypothetical protein